MLKGLDQIDAVMKTVSEQIQDQLHEVSSCHDSEFTMRSYWFEFDRDGERFEVKSTVMISEWDLKWNHEWETCPDDYEDIENLIEGQL